MAQSIKIISPIPGKGLHRKYTARPKILSESNYIELGIIVRDNKGNLIKDAIVKIEATDESQNQTIEGTGNVKPIYENKTVKGLHQSVKIKVPYYPFHYEFRTAGDHTITFIVDGKSESIKLKAVAPKKNDICKS